MPKIAAPTLAQHREATWRKLHDSFLQALAEEGYASLSLASVARRAGIARNTIYNYAPTKEALLLAIIREEAEPFIEELIRATTSVSGPEERLVCSIERALAAFAPGTRALPVLDAMEDIVSAEVTSAINATFAPAIALLVEIVQDGVREGLFRPILDLRRTVEMVIAVVVVARRAILAGEPLETVTAETTAFLTGALRSAPRS